jgi:cystathionine gamma-synthase
MFAIGNVLCRWSAIVFEVSTVEYQGMERNLGLNTRCVHAAHSPDAGTGAVAEPIYLSTTFERDADGGYARGYRYSREGTPNRTALEQCVAALEGGVGALACSSGLAANIALLELLKPGEQLIAPREGYFGTLQQFREHAAGRGITVTFADFTDVASIKAAVTPATRMLWVETPANPLLSVTDLAQVVEIGRQCGARVVCDNTFATPVCQRPFEFGVDVVMHSGTKYFGGHSDVLSGALVVREDRALLEQLASWQRLTGAALAPFDCWLLRRSIATLALRVRQQCATAARLAESLSTHPKLERVLYPGLPRHPGHALARRQMQGGFGAILSICVVGGAEAAMALTRRTRLFTRATSLGGVESLIEHRASIEGPTSVAPANLLRLSVGIEDADDLSADLVEALG